MNTLKALEKRFSDLIAKEEARRKKLQPDKRKAMADSDEEEFKKLEEYFKEDDEDIANVWYSPKVRNLHMLKSTLNKVRDALRRNANAPRNDAIGTVPSLLDQYWAAMDQARKLMIAGDLDGAQNTLDQDKSFNLIIRLNDHLLPQEFKTPLNRQRQHLDQEIKKEKNRDRIYKKA